MIYVGSNPVQASQASPLTMPPLHLGFLRHDPHSHPTRAICLLKRGEAMYFDGRQWKGLYGEHSKQIFSKSLYFVPTRGGGSLTQSQLFKTKTTTIQSSNFVGILSQYGGGSPVPTKKITKNHIKNHQSPKKCNLFMKKLYA